MQRSAAARAWGWLEFFARYSFPRFRHPIGSYSQFSQFGMGAGVSRSVGEGAASAGVFSRA